jgi:hypothetical protein
VALKLETFPFFFAVEGEVSYVLSFNFIVHVQFLCAVKNVYDDISLKLAKIENFSNYFFEQGKLPQQPIS